MRGNAAVSRCEAARQVRYAPATSACHSSALLLPHPLRALSAPLCSTNCSFPTFSRAMLLPMSATACQSRGIL